MTSARMIELAAAVVIVVGGVWLYRSATARSTAATAARARCCCSSSARSWRSTHSACIEYRPSARRARGDEGARAMIALHLPACLTTACAATQAAGAVAPGAPGFLARPVARLHLPGRLAGVAVRAQRRDLRRAQQRRLVRLRLFPRHRRVRRRRPQTRSPRPVVRARADRNRAPRTCPIDSASKGA